MNRQSIITILRNHAPELKAAGLVHLRLFGSAARDESNPHSDIDLLAEFDSTKQVTLVTVGSLQSRLGDLLGTEVELSTSEWMKEPVRKQALEEAVLAF